MTLINWSVVAGYSCRKCSEPARRSPKDGAVWGCSKCQSASRNLEADFTRDADELERNIIARVRTRIVDAIRSERKSASLDGLWDRGYRQACDNIANIVEATDCVGENYEPGHSSDIPF